MAIYHVTIFVPKSMISQYYTILHAILFFNIYIVVLLSIFE
jgi:hypothetical protein